MQGPATGRRCATFSTFVVDFGSRELLHEGRKIALQEKPFQILAILLETPGEIVTREEFRQKLWPADTFVDFEHSINTAVRKLRDALGDNADTPVYIETIPRRGYRFIATVDQLSAVGRTPPIVGLQQSPITEITSKPKTIIFSIAFVGFLILVATFTARHLSAPLLNPVAPLPSSPIQSLAVLPRQNLYSDPEQEYFVDGLTDALITDLGKLGGIRVISRTSVMRYKGVAKPLPKIAEELKVDAVIEGTVLRSGNRVRITTQLVRAVPEEHLWAESYERELTDVLLLQEQLSSDIAGQILKNVSATEPAGHHVRPVNANAYDSYLRGRFFLEKRVSSEIRKAIASFEQAINLDRTYAPAYSGLADCYIVTWSAEFKDWKKGEEYAREALRMQDDLAEAHASLGVVRLYQFDLKTAKSELKRAIELNPNYSPAHHWYALYLMAAGKLDEALAENEAAREINPFSLPVNNARGIILTAMRQYDEALAQATRMGELEDNYAVHERKALVYRLKGMWKQYLTEQLKSAVYQGDKQRASDLEEAERIFVHSGYAACARRFVELKKKNYLHPYGAAEIAVDYVELGDNDAAIEWLRRAYDDRDFTILELRAAPEFDRIRSDPRFQELIRRLPSPE